MRTRKKTHGFEVKDRVIKGDYRNKGASKGMIVELLPWNKAKVLWDHDWHSGRTYVYKIADLKNVGW